MSGSCPSLGSQAQSLLYKSEGLRHLEIHILTSSRSSRAAPPLEQLKCFARESGFVLLRDMGLKSIRLTLSVSKQGDLDLDKPSLMNWIRLEVEKIVPKQQQLLTAD
jgi:hypothetical protein